MPHMSSYLQSSPHPLPYIGLKARLCQVVLNQWTILLLIMVVKLVLFQSSLKYSLLSARQYSLLTCSSAQTMASTLATIPQQLTTTANSLISKGIDQSIVGLISTLQFLVTGIQNLIIFSLEMLVGTYACLAVSFIDGAVDGIANATESVISFTNKELSTAADDLQSGLDKISDALNDVAIFVSNIESFFTGDTEGINQVNLTISSLKSFSIPTSINSKLETLKQNTPNYTTVKGAIIDEIKNPFSLINKQLNTSLQNSIKFQPVLLKSTSNSSSIAVCKLSNINSIFDQITTDINFLFKIFIITMAILALFVCLPTIYSEYQYWKWLNTCSEIKIDRSELEHSPKEENMIIINMALSHWKIRLQDIVANLFNESVNITLSRWYIDYISYHPMLNSLILGLCGVVIVGLQFTLLKVVKRELPGLEQEISDIISNLVWQLNVEVDSWVDDTNNSINNTETDINKNLLGWVETGTSSVNSTLSLFLTSMNKALSDTFEDTPLYKPITSVFQCVIGSKIDEVIKGLTWVHDKSQVSLPRINESLIYGDVTSSLSLNDTIGSNNTIALSKRNINTISSINESSINSSLSPIVDKLISTYEKSLKTELYVSISLVGIWILFAIIGFIYCYIQSYRFSSKDATTSPDLQIAPSPIPERYSRYSEKLLPNARGASTQQPAEPVEQGWSYNWFHPPSFLANDPYTQRTPIPSPMIPPPPTPLEVKHTMPLSVKVNHPSMVRISARATSDYIRD